MRYRNENEEKRADYAISKDCAAIGIKIESAWDLVGSKGDHLWSREIAEVFAKHVIKPYPPIVIEGLIFAGAWLETKDLFFNPVLKILRANGTNSLGQSAANALLKMIEPHDESVLREQILDQSVGVSRNLLIAGYAKLAKKNAIETLQKILNDEEVRLEALKSLSMLGDQSIRPKLQLILKHSDSYFRKIARDALVRLDKKAAKTTK
jgi:hypothetical protein